MARIDDLIRETAERDWDTHGAEPIPEKLWREAERLASHRRIPEPFLSPGGDGGVNMRWSDEKGHLIDVELCTDLVLRWHAKVNGERSEGTFGYLADMLVKLREMFP